MITKLEVRNIRCLDGLHYSFGVLGHFHNLLYTTCCEILKDTSNVMPALACCWGFVDALYRIREIAQSLPRLSEKNPEMRAFLSATKLVERYRHYIQHLRNELSKDPPNAFPVWGSLSWVDKFNDERYYTAILGTQIEGTTNPGCVYDTVNKMWVSKVCLSTDRHSFNFDPIYEATLRFKKFVVPFLMKDVSESVRVYNELLIVTTDFKPKGESLTIQSRADFYPRPKRATRKSR